MGGWLGDTILVNGTPNPFLTVAPTLYRFRMVNASNARVYNIGLSDGKQFTIIGNDGGLLEKPVQVTSVMLAQAERLDVIVDLSSYLQGQSVTIKSLPFSFGGSPGSGTVPQGAELDLLQLQITKTGSSGGIIPQTLSQITKYDPANAIKTRSFEMQMHFINTKSFSMDRIDEKVKLGDLEQWTFANLSEDIHPMHVHGLQFQVLNRSGESQPSDEGWKDTVRVGPAEIVNVLLRYSDYVGLYLVHCHNLEHEDDGMMANVLVEASGKVKQEPDKSGLLRIHPNPATDETTLDFPLLEHEEILRVLDVRGAILHELICRTGTKNLTLELSKFLIGRYEVQLGNYRAHLNVIR